MNYFSDFVKREFITILTLGIIVALPFFGYQIISHFFPSFNSYIALPKFEVKLVSLLILSLAVVAFLKTRNIGIFLVLPILLYFLGDLAKLLAN